MKPTLFALAFTAGLASSAAAEADLTACAATDPDLDRLACYDRLSGRTMVPETLPSPDNWEIRSETSAFEDTTDIFMHVSSDAPVACGYSGARPLRLFLRCVENTTALIIATHCHVTSGHGGYGQVEYRIDERPTVTRNFTDSTNNRSLGLWRGAQSIPMIKNLLGAQSLLVRFTPFNENPVTARFDISGLETSIAPLRESCNW